MKKILAGEVRFNRCGSSGNIYCVMGMASKNLRRCGRKEDAEEMVKRVTEGEAKDYEGALKIIGEYVKLIEDGSSY